MRAPTIVCLLVLSPVLAGCLGADLDPSGTTGPPMADVGFPAAPEAFAYLLCAGDILVPLADGGGRDCNAHATSGSGPAAEVHLAVNPLDPLNLVGGSKDFTLGEDARCGTYNVWSGVHWSKDGGRTWHHDLLPGHPGDDRKTALSQYACGSDPVLAFGPDGVLYYASIHYTDDPDEAPPLPQLAPFMGYPTVNAGLAVTRSLDGGETWEDPVVIIHREDGSLIDKEWLAVDPHDGTLYVTYYDTGNGNLELVRSRDGGLTWDGPFVFLEQDDDTAGQFAQVAVDHEGQLHVIHWVQGSLTEEPSAIWHITSDDGGETWSTPRRVGVYFPILDLEFTHKYRIVPMPALAVDTNDGSVHVAYPWLDTGGNLDILAASSTDGGATWTTVRVNDDVAGPQNEQWMPAIAVGPDGIVHLTWMDYREDPAGQSARVYYSYSTDEGATWSPNVAVSDVPFDGEGGYHQSGSGTIGDYMGLAVSDHAVHPFWADTRFGRNDVFSAIILATMG